MDILNLNFALQILLPRPFLPAPSRRPSRRICAFDVPRSEFVRFAFSTVARHADDALAFVCDCDATIWRGERVPGPHLLWRILRGSTWCLFVRLCGKRCRCSASVPSNSNDLVQYVPFQVSVECNMLEYNVVISVLAGDVLLRSSVMMAAVEDLRF